MRLIILIVVTAMLLAAQGPAKPDPPSTPVISDRQQAIVFKAQAEFIQAQNNVQVAQAALQAAIQEARSECKGLELASAAAPAKPGDPPAGWLLCSPAAPAVAPAEPSKKP